MGEVPARSLGLVDHGNVGRQVKKVLNIDVIRLDFQPKENLIEETVQEYLAILQRGETVSPVRVRFDGKDYFLEDGFHRLEATRRAGLTKVKAVVIPGTLEDMEAEFAEYLKALKRSLASPAQ